MESLKIILLCMSAAIVYGIVHDQFTARICVEYFTVFHPPIFSTQSPTLLGIGWGIIATWWMGAFLGTLLAIAARAGSRSVLSAAQLVRPIGKLLLLMAATAILFGFAGFVLTRYSVISTPPWLASQLSIPAQSRFIADWWAHSASYASGTVGGIVLCVMTYKKRTRTH